MDEFNDSCDIQNKSKYKHERTIIHIDLDCFYAQVEMLKNPDLATKPIGIKQQHYLITSNYIAREFGIRKCMTITEALALCPKLIIINGEDLHDYRVMSSRVTDVIRQFSGKVEKLGFDENFVDVTEIVSKRLPDNLNRSENKLEGHVFKNTIEDVCTCGCQDRLFIGSHIASEIRERIKEELEMTCCAGIAHNKLLAKLVCPTHKPNQQTTVFPCAATTLMSNLKSVRAIPGVGRKTSDVLEALGISQVQEVQNAPVTLLEKHLGKTLAGWIKAACFGVDDSDVKVSGKQQVIGLEEACREISSMENVESRLNSLIDRGLVLLKEDGRCPTTIRVSVRKYYQGEYTRQRETKQCAINPSLFRTDLVKEHILEASLRLFKMIVDHKKPFHLTLIGIAFTKFQEEMPAKSSLLQFMKSKPLKEASVSEFATSDIQPCSSRENFEPETNGGAKMQEIIMKDIDESVLTELPENIRAEILDDYSQQISQFAASTSPVAKNNMSCPSGIDPDVFSALPHDIQLELAGQTNNNNVNKCVKNKTSMKQKSILNFFKK